MEISSVFVYAWVDLCVFDLCFFRDFNCVEKKTFTEQEAIKTIKAFTFSLDMHRLYVVEAQIAFPSLNFKW